MKISCQSCQAKYTIADEKVLGKIVKIRCKKCGATIVINGNEQAAGSPSSESAVFDYTAQGGAGGDQWTVNVADGDQRSMSQQEIVQEFRAGVVNDETYCWKDGMADWLPLREIEQLYTACTIGPRPSLENYTPSDRPPPVAASFDNGGSTEEVPIQSMRGELNGNGANGGLFGNMSPAAAPVAARRVGGRGGGDLFGAASAAGGEDDVMTSAPAGAPDSQGDGKLTGQRNENSVLFSLTALTTNETSKKPEIQNDGSGLIDIRALSQNMSEKKDSRNNHVDDIMNLGGGGAFGAALAAPILAPPPLDANELMGGNAGAGKSKNMVMFIGIGVVMLAMLGTIVFLVTRKPETPVAQPIPTSTMTAAPTDTTPTTAPTTTTTAGTGAVAMNDSTPKAPTDTPKAPTDKPTPTRTGGGGGGGAHTGGGGGGGGAAAPAAAAPVDTPKPPAGGGGGNFQDALRSAAGGGGGAAAPAPAAASDRPFDRGAAAAALGGVNVASCKKSDGPTGSGHVSVTFAGDGSVATAVVDQPPFAGTPVGGCVAGKFRGAHIPAFSGGNIKVGKSFVIN